MTHQPRLIKEEEPRDQYDEDQKAAYRERLRQKLQDPDFRQIEGFPIGEDEDILALSDPPYYTACPNPFLPEIIEQWQEERKIIRQQLNLPEDEINGDYHQEPFASDVSEGKNNPIYNAHSYHTKVPHKAIMRYILHFTDPGDIVFDGFCGTGMTGIAAQLCADRKELEALGLYVDAEGYIYESPPLPSTSEPNPALSISRLGLRKTILNDLSPAASFIAYNYNSPVDSSAFELEAHRILRESDHHLGWMYETWHPDSTDPDRMKARINYTVWSELFACPSCGREIVYFDAAVDKDTFRVQKEFECPHCGLKLKKRALERIWEAYYDEALHKNSKRVRYVPVLINYQIDKHRLEKSPDEADLNLLERINSSPIDSWFPIHEMPDGERKGKDGYHLKGITYLHDFYFRRALKEYAYLWSSAASSATDPSLPFSQFFVQGNCLGFTRMNRYQPIQFGRKGGSQVNRYFSGTLFVGSLISEVSPRYAMTNKLKRLVKLALPGKTGATAITCQSTTALEQIPADSIDYVFVDPPFGNNLHYSELNFFWEAWLRVLTQREPEAVMDKGRNRTLPDYQELMTLAFEEIYRVLKPGRWITVEFHNSQNRVWNSIQEAILRAGFVVADVRTLDKKQETYKQSIQNLVKADLVISAYKPTTEFQRRFLNEAGTEEGVWRFVNQHLANLAGVTQQDGILTPLSERQDYLLFDRMIAFHIQRGASVPLSATEFYAGLQERFSSEDGMFFLPEQFAQYQQERLKVQEVAQLSLFVSDEKSAIQWLRQQLDPLLGGSPQTYQNIQPQFLRQLHQTRHEALPELRDLLEQNFLQDDEGRWYTPDPAKAGDLEQLRHRSLMREFNTYLNQKKRLKQFRTEAIREGFADAWSKGNYNIIIKVAERLPERVLQEDPNLLMYYDTAGQRV